ncbi:hypothetical protein C8R46DRAFT_1350785 [Mycena filopes]|nr:hypothetical protein C8R46DRAFT_1350785 [Mycena filopes]
MRTDLTYLRLGNEHHHNDLDKTKKTGLDVTAARYSSTRLDNYGCHPIQSLPVELISEIFVHCLPAKAQEQQHLHTLTAPLLLTRVCGTWRAIALRTPELWSSVFFEHCNIPAGLLPSKVQMLEYWLARGAAHPLTLRLHYRQPCALLVPLLSAQSTRWEDVDLFLHPATLAAFNNSSLASAERLQLPVLRRLSFGCCPLRPLRDADAPLHITAFSDAPQLADVSLLQLPPSAVTLPWAQLTRFYCQAASPPDVLGVLQLAPALQHLRLDLQHATPLASDVEPCVHTSLLSLTLHAHPAAPISIPALLAPLTLPFLHTLALPPISADDIGALTAFAARSHLGCSLRRLSLPLAPLGPGALRAVLRPLRALEKLELRYPGEAALLDVLHMLSGSSTKQDGDAEDELPALRTLSIDSLRTGAGVPIPIPYCALLAALQARSVRGPTGSVQRLDSFVLTVNAAVLTTTTDPDLVYVRALRALKARGGMDVDIAVGGKGVTSRAFFTTS